MRGRPRAQGGRSVFELNDSDRKKVDMSEVPGKVTTPPVIDEKLSTELLQYKGKWVAVDQINRKVVGSGDTALEAKEAADKAHVTDPLIFRVSAHPERVNLL